MNGCNHRPHRNPDIDEHGLGKLERTLQRFRHGMTGSCAIEFGSVRTVASAGHDQQVRVCLAQFSHQALCQNRLVHGEHQSEGILDPELVERVGARRISESRADALALGVGNEVGVRVDCDIGLVMRFQHPRDQLADTARADDDDAWLVHVFCRQFGYRLDTPPDDPADMRKQGRHCQADRRDDLPELGRTGLDQQSRRCSGNDDQRVFGRAGHENARLDCRTAACAHQIQQRRGDKRLERQQADDRDGDCADVLEDTVDIDRHAHGQQEYP